MIMGENIHWRGEKGYPCNGVKFNFEKITFRLGFGEQSQSQ